MRPVDCMNLAVKLCKAWHSQPNPPKVHVDGQRIHHYQVGLAGLVGGIAAYYDGDKKAGKNMMAFSAPLVVDDFADLVRDASNWYKRIKRQDNEISYLHNQLSYETLHRSNP